MNILKQCMIKEGNVWIKLSLLWKWTEERI